LTAESPIDQLLAAASPLDRLVIEGLSRELQLSGASRAADARALAESTEKEKQALEEQRKKKSDEYDKLREELRKSLVNRWPELSNCWNPQVADLLGPASQEVVTLVESSPSFSQFWHLPDEIGALEQQKFDLDRRWVKCQRLVRALENAAYTGNLPKTATPEVQERIKQLLAAEATHLGP
jgi:hypothetical protein